MQLDHDGQATSGYLRCKDLAARLARLSDRCVTNRQVCQGSVVSRGKHTQIPTLPVLSSNIGEPETVMPLSERSTAGCLDEAVNSEFIENHWQNSGEPVNF